MLEGTSYFVLLLTATTIQALPLELGDKIDYDIPYLDEIYDNDEWLDLTASTDVIRPRRNIGNETKEYLLSCGRLFEMRKGRVISLKSFKGGQAQYPAGASCEWSFLGSPDCIPEISCEKVDVRCSMEQLIIFDGMDGGVKLCDESHQGKVWKPSGGRDLSVIFNSAKSTSFNRLYRGFSCTVKCAPTDVPKLPFSNQIFRTDSSCECGIFDKGGQRVVGGVNARPFEFPWIATLVAPGGRSGICGGSLINSKFILSAAHCFMTEDKQIPQYDVLIHAHDLSKSDKSEHTERRKIVKVRCHRWYDKKAKYDSDICLLELDSEIDITKHTPVCLPEPQTEVSDAEHNQTAMVAGWGTMIENGKGATILQKLSLPVVGHSICQELFKLHKMVITETMLCAGYIQGTKDACQGDSGGPLIRKVHKDSASKADIIGVVSWGIGCARKGFLGIYSRVSEFVPWIRLRAMGGKWCRR